MVRWDAVGAAQLADDQDAENLSSSPLASGFGTCSLKETLGQIADSSSIAGSIVMHSVDLAGGKLTQTPRDLATAGESVAWPSQCVC